MILWDRPNTFDPDRFAPEAGRGLHRFSYLPFGAAPRACIGAGFAMVEAQINLASLLARFSFDLPSGFRAAADVVDASSRWWNAAAGGGGLNTS